MNCVPVGRKKLFKIVPMLAAVAAVAACTSPEPTGEAPSSLDGRYEISALNMSAKFDTIWFGKSGKYEGIIANCQAACTEHGTYSYVQSILTLRPDAGGEQISTLTGLAPSTVSSQPHVRAHDVRTLAESGTEQRKDDDPCGAGASSLGPRDEGSSSEATGLLSDGVSCLLQQGVLGAFVSSDGSTGKRTRSRPTRRAAPGVRT